MEDILNNIKPSEEHISKPFYATMRKSALESIKEGNQSDFDTKTGIMKKVLDNFRGKRDPLHQLGKEEKDVLYKLIEKEIRSRLDGGSVEEKGEVKILDLFLENIDPAADIKFVWSEKKNKSSPENV